MAHNRHGWSGFGLFQAKMTIGQADQFLADCVRAALAGQPSPPWPADLQAPSGQDLIVERASFHGIAVLLGRAEAMLSDWPVPAADGLRHEMRLAALWEELHRKQLTRILARLAEAGIETVLLKGTALAYLFYEDPAMRRRGDTDLLIHPRDLAAARRVLTDAGSERREDPHGLFFQETWMVDCGAGMMHPIDLHWEPSDRPVLQNILQAEHYWRQRVPLPRLSPDAFAPSSAMMVVHGAVNQAWHIARGYAVEETRIKGGRRLIWAVDYLKLTRAFDDAAWRELAGFCETTDAAGIVHSALAGARDDIGLDVPPDIMLRLERAAHNSPSLAYITGSGVLRDFWCDLRASRSWKMRWRLVSAMLLAPRSHLVAKYPDCAHWPTGLLQIRRYGAYLANGISR